VINVQTLCRLFTTASYNNEVIYAVITLPFDYVIYLFIFIYLFIYLFICSSFNDSVSS
jgi:hypothetical protein